MSGKPRRMQHCVLFFFFAWAASTTKISAQTMVETYQIDVTAYELLSVRRINRFEYRYRYRVRIENNSTSLASLRGNPTSSNAAVKVLSSSVNFGSVDELGASITDLVVVHSRRTRFRADDISWVFEGEDATSEWVPISLEGRPVTFSAPPNLIQTYSADFSANPSEVETLAVFKESPNQIGISDETPLPGCGLSLSVISTEANESVDVILETATRRSITDLTEIQTQAGTLYEARDIDEFSGLDTTSAYRVARDHLYVAASVGSAISDELECSFAPRNLLSTLITGQ